MVVGDELLTGRVIDTNSALLGRMLDDIGLRLTRVTRVADSEPAIREAIRTEQAELLFVIGGLGPTPDDCTLAALAAEFRLQLKVDRQLLAGIQERFRRRGRRMPVLARRQALVPAGAQLLANPLGMVPGMVIARQKQLVILLPGVPQEFEALVRESVIPLLRERFGCNTLPRLLLRTFGIPESAIAERVKCLLAGHRRVRVGYYPSVTGVDIVLRARSAAALKSLQNRLRRTLGDAVYTTSEQTIQEAIAEQLLEQRASVAVAESCTGGLVGDMLTSVPGSSEWFVGGVICYSNLLKMLLCGVREATLARYGAVSRETVFQMARGVRALAGADFGLAVSGIAGPGGGSESKPVGLVYVGVADSNRVVVERHLFNGNRRMVKEQSAMAGLILLLRQIRRRIRLPRQRATV
ncbi:MAG: CinA family nicotinamide mononucleotide deamidase-related protein [candidate division WOR-3 bacterium]